MWLDEKNKLLICEESLRLSIRVDFSLRLFKRHFYIIIIRNNKCCETPTSGISSISSSHKLIYMSINNNHVALN